MCHQSVDISLKISYGGELERFEYSGEKVIFYGGPDLVWLLLCSSLFHKHLTEEIQQHYTKSE